MGGRDSCGRTSIAGRERKIGDGKQLRISIDTGYHECRGSFMSVKLAYPHIQKDACESARLSRVPRVRVAQIVMDYLTHGWSADEICRQHPFLKPAEVHAALTYY